MTLSTAINNTKKKLIKRYNEKGLYENFGQMEYYLLWHQFIDSSCYSREMNLMREKLIAFNDWAMNFNG